MKSDEANININGTTLSSGQSMAVRVAINNMLIEMRRPGCLGSDEHGEKMRTGYQTRLGEVCRLLKAAPPEKAVTPVDVPDTCTGKAIVFEGGTLHVRKDGSGYIVVDEEDFILEDDRQEGPDGPEGSIHWIARFPAGEMNALRNFLNGQDFAAPEPPTASHEQADERRGVDIGLAMAAGILMRTFDNETYAREILNAAGLHTLEKLKEVGVDEYDIEALMPIAAPADGGS